MEGADLVGAVPEGGGLVPVDPHVHEGAPERPGVLSGLDGGAADVEGARDRLLLLRVRGHGVPVADRVHGWRDRQSSGDPPSHVAMDKLSL